MLNLQQTKVLRFIAQTLQQHGIAFQLTGGLAAIAYGANRPLYDIDIDINCQDINTVRELFKDYITEDFYHLVDEEFDMWLLSLEIEGVPVDISQAQESYFLKSDGMKVRMDTEITHAQPQQLGDLRVPVQRKDELLAYKQIIARDTDLQDILQITKIV